MKTAIAWIIHSILPAWIAKLVVEVPTMSELPDAVQAALNPAPATAPDAVAVVATVVKAIDPAAAPIADAVIAMDAMIPAGTISKLETILSALGHSLPPFWAEAVALAKKA